MKKNLNPGMKRLSLAFIFLLSGLSLFGQLVAPTNLTFSFYTDSTVLSWDEVATGSPDSYLVFASDKADTVSAQQLAVVDISDTSYKIEGSSSYSCFWVRTKSGSDTSDFSSIACTTMPTNGLVAWYPFNGNAQNVVENLNHGAVYSATLTTDKDNNVQSAFNFNGSSYILATAHGFPYGKQPRTVSLWINPSGNGGIFSYGPYNCSGKSFGLYTSYNTLNFWGSCANYETNITVPTGSWSHILLTYDGNEVDFYFNGVFKDSFIVDLNTEVSGLVIGAYNAESLSSKINAKIDELAVYSRVLNQSEISSLYNLTGIKNEISVLDFGKVAISDDSARTYKIINTGLASADYIINSVGLPFQVTPETITIAAGSTYDVNLSFNPTAIGEFSDTLIIEKADHTMPVQKLVLTGNCVTQKQGAINVSTTWTKANSPYFVTNGGIAISKGIKLTIEEGVTVIMDSMCRVIVYGELDVQGTASEPVKFVKEEDIFNSIFVHNAKANLVFAEISGANHGIYAENSQITCSNSKFRNSNYGIYLDNSSAYLSNLDIANMKYDGIYGTSSSYGELKNSTLNYNNYGLYLVSYSNMNVSGVTASYNRYYGIRISDNRGKNIINNTCNYNEIGIYLDNPGVVKDNITDYNVNMGLCSCSGTLTNNVARNNGGYGLYIQCNAKLSGGLSENNGKGMYLENSKISSVAIRNNNGNGIDAYSSNTYIQSSLITGNKGEGIYFTYPSYNIIIKSNFISNNIGNGIVIEDYEGVVISNNDIIDNGKSGILTNTKPIVNFNNIYDNSLYDFEVQQVSPDSINAKNNWWGTNVLLTILDNTYDYNDNIDLISLTLQPLLNNSTSTPDTIKGFTAQALDGNSVKLSWQPIAKAKNYYLYKSSIDGNVDTTVIWQTLDSAALDYTSALPQGNYQFAIRSKDIYNTYTPFAFLYHRSCSVGDHISEISPALPYIEEGKALTLTVSTDYTATYQWQFKRNGNWVNFTNDINFTGSDNASFTMVHVADSLENIPIRATLTHTCGTDTSAEVSFKLASKLTRNLVIRNTNFEFNELIIASGQFANVEFYFVNTGTGHIWVDSIAGISKPFSCSPSGAFTIEANDSVKVTLSVDKGYRAGNYVCHPIVVTRQKAASGQKGIAPAWGKLLCIFNGKQIFESNESYNSATAASMCEAESYNLLTISSAEENTFIQQHITTWYWIGLNDAATEGTWVWQSKKPVIYTNWNTTGEPNGGTDQNYGVVETNGLWYDYPNYYENKFLFEGTNLSFSASCMLRNQSPRLLVTIDTVDFGTYKPSSLTNETRTITLENNGEGMLIVDSIEGISAPFSHNASFPLSISSGSSSDITLTLTRNYANGAYTNYATIYSNDSTYLKTTDTSSLTAFYPFEGSNECLLGSASDANLDGAEFTMDRFQNLRSALKLNGSSPVSIPSGNAFRFTNKNFAISFWFTLNDINKTNNGFIGRDYYEGISLNYNYSSNKRLNLWIDANGQYSWDFDYSPLKNDWEANKWYHCVLQRDGNNISIYINNQKIGEKTYTNTINNPSTPFYIGRSHSSEWNHNGNLDDLMVYQRSLSAGEIESIYEKNAKSSFTVTGKLEYLPAPQNFAGKFFKEKTQLSWDAVAGSDMESYKVYRGEQIDTSTFKLIATVPSGTVSFEDNTILPSRDYIYRIKTLDTAGFESYFSIPVSTSLMPIENVYAWLPMDGNANDVSGNGHNGTLNGPLNSANRLNDEKSSYLFSDYQTITLNNTTSDRLDNGFSISAWVNVKNLNDNSNQNIIKKHSSNGLKLNIYNTVNYRMWVGHTEKYSTESFKDSKWHLLTFTHNPSDDSSYLYIDGIKDGSMNSKYNYSDIAPFVIGGDYFRGNIDNVIIYNKFISNKELSNLHNAESSKVSFGTIALGSESVKKVQLVNHDTVELRYNVLPYTGSFILSENSIVIPPKDTIQLTVKFLPSALGTHSDTIFIENEGNSNPLIKMVLKGSAVTQVCGIIGENTTWTKANSPYYINCSFGVDDGYTLTIEEGVTVLIDSAKQISIDGKIVVNGTEDEPVIIKPFGDIPLNRIYFRNGDGDLNFCKISGASNAAIYTENTVNLNMDHCTIENNNEGIFAYNEGLQGTIQNSIIRNNKRGIRIQGSSRLNIIDNTIANNIGNDEWSVQIDNNNNYVIENNRITGGRYGLHLYYAKTKDNFIADNQYGGVYYSNVTSVNDTIANNGTYGANGNNSSLNGTVIKDNGTYGADGSYMDYTNCTVSGNNGYGIDTYNASVLNSIISGNAGKGITGSYITIQYCEISGNNIGIGGSNNRIEYCKIFNNTTAGISYTTNRDYRPQYNEIYGNKIGIDIYNTTNIHYNNFYNNTQYDVYAHLAGNDSIDARFNYWDGATTTAQVKDKNFDFYDDGTTVKVYVGSDISPVPYWKDTVAPTITANAFPGSKYLEIICSEPVKSILPDAISIDHGLNAVSVSQACQTRFIIGLDKNIPDIAENINISVSNLSDLINNIVGNVSASFVPRPTIQRLTIVPDTLNFGSLSPSLVLKDKLSFNMVNTGEQALRIDSVTGLKTPFGYNLTLPLVVPSNDSVEVEIELNRNSKEASYLNNAYFYSNDTIAGNIAGKSGLVAWWPLNNSGIDLGPSKINGTVNGAVPVKGVNGLSNSALYFNGTSDNISFGNTVPSALQLQNEITISAWVYITEWRNDDVMAIVSSQRDACNGSGVSLQIDGRLNPESMTAPRGHIHFQIGDGVSFHATNTATQLPLNTWVHIVASRKANENARIFFNGILQPSSSVAWSGQIFYNCDSWQQFAIGHQYDYYDRYFKGNIDEVRIYNRAINYNEIQALYQSALPKQLVVKAQLKYIQPPSGLTALYYKDKIDLSWNAVSASDLAGYKVYRAEANDTLKAVSIANVAEGTTTYSDESVVPSKDYYYWIKAVDDLGYESAFSNMVNTDALDYTGLVAWFPFNGNANDLSGKGNNGTVYGAISAADRTGTDNSAYTFSGSEYIKTPVSGFSFGKEPRTISVWVNPSTDGDGGRVFAYGRPYNSREVFGMIKSSNRVYFWSQYNDNHFNQKMPVNSWNNYVFRYNGSSVDLFFNGKKVEQFAINDLTTSTTNSDLFIGINKDANNNPSGYPFYGSIDDIAVYNYALNDNAVSNLSSKNYINFGMTENSNLKTDTIVISNATASVKDYTISSPITPFAVETNSITVPANGLVKIPVSFQPTQTGFYNDTIYVEDNTHIEKVKKISLSGSSVTNACGIIGENTTWTKANSPYYINCNFNVESGVTLTIEAGVTVLLDSARKLALDGRLVANGTVAEKVQFKAISNYNMEGIVISSTGEAYLSYVTISRANQAFSIASGGKINLYAGNIEGCNGAINGTSVSGKVENTTIRNNKTNAIYSTGSSRLEIINNLIENNTCDWAIYFDSNNNYPIKGNRIINNKNGVYVSYAEMSENFIGYNDGYGVTCYYTNLTNDTIEFNNARGLYAYYYSHPTLTGLVVKNNNGTGIETGNARIQLCTISNNLSYGIYGDGSSIASCIVKNNQANGIQGSWNNISYCEISGNIIGINGSCNEISNNIITNNISHGISQTNTDRTGAISYNDIIDNGQQGIDIFGLGNINYNNIYDNDGYNVYAHYKSSTDSIDARYNFWNASSLTKIREHTYDYYDASGEVRLYLGPEILGEEVKLQPISNISATSLAGGNVKISWSNHPKAYQYYLYTDNGSGHVDSLHVWKVLDSLTNNITVSLSEGFYIFGVQPVAYNDNSGYLTYSNTVFSDNTPPTLLSVFGLPGDTLMVVTFSEPVDSVTALSSNWTIDNGLAVKALIGLSGNKVTLLITGNLPNINTAVTLGISNVADTLGNVANTQSIVFYTDDGNNNPEITVSPKYGEVKDNIVINYVISDTENDAVTIHPQYSVNFGKTWKSATITGDTLNLASTAYTGQLIWNSYTDLPGIQNNYVLFRIVPRDGDPKNNGTPGMTNFMVLDNNLEPTIAIPFISGEVHDSVVINYSISDPEGDALKIVPEYYDEVLKFWERATVLGDTINITNGTHSITWLSKTDLPTGTTTVPFRISPYDYEIGVADTVDLLLDNIGISSVQITNTIAAEVSGDVVFNYLIQDDESDLITLNISYTTDGWKTSYVPTISRNVTNIASADYSGSFTWNSVTDLAGKDFKEVIFRFVPHDSNDGIIAEKTFRVDNNAIPQSTLSNITGLKNGDITLRYNLSDTENDNLNIRFLYYHNSQWDTCTVTGTTNQVKPANYASSIVWNSSTDMPQADGIYKIRIIPFDNDLGIGDTVEVWVNNLQRIDLGNDQEICRGESVNIYAGSYSDYLWNDSSVNTSNEVTETGQYYVKAHDWYGLTYYSDTVQITVHELPAPDLGSDVVICYGSNYTFDAGNFSSYLWSDYSTGQYLYADTTGTHMVEVTDANGCKNTDTVNIFAQVPFKDDTIQFVTVNDSLQKNVVVWHKTPSAGTSMYNLYREKGTNNYEKIGSVPFDSASYYIDKTSFPAQSNYRYKITVTDSCNAEYDVNKAVVHSTLFLQVNKGSGGYDLNWTAYTGAEVDYYEIYRGPATDSLTYLNGTSGLTTSFTDNTNPSCVVYYQVRAVLKNMYTGTMFNTVSSNIADNGVLPALPVIAGTAEVCAGESASLDAGNFTSYLWNNGKTTQTIAVTAAGSYTVTVTNDGGCRATSKPFHVKINPKPQFDLGNDTSICSNTHLQIKGPAVMVSYLWNTGSVNQNISISKTGLYSLTASDSLGCSNTDEVLITYQNPPAIRLDSIEYICDQESRYLDPGEFASYLWNTGSTNRMLKVSSPTALTITVTDVNGCSNSKQVTVDTKNASKVSLGKDTSLCSNDSIKIAPLETYTKYLWSNGATTENIWVKRSGKYTVWATDVFKCTSSDTIEVSVKELPQAPYLGADTTLCYVKGFTLNAGSGYAAYKWNTGAVAQKLVVESSGTYEVEVTGANGCINNDDITVNMIVPYDKEKLCLVTIDNETGKNLLVWERTSGKGTAAYMIYKETNQSGVYNPIDTVPYNDLSIYLDKSSVPGTRSERYRISVIDSCGNESDPSESHKTMHLTINVGVNEQFNLIWESYQGIDFKSYVIYRGTSAENLEILDTVPNNIISYTDAPPQGTYFYQIAMVLPGICRPAKFLKAGAGPYSEAVSNMEKRIKYTNSVQLVKLGDIKVYPTVVKEYLNIKTLGNKVYDNVVMELVSINGQNVKRINLKQISGLQTIKMPELPSGLYLLKLSGNGLMYNTKIEIQ